MEDNSNLISENLEIHLKFLYNPSFFIIDQFIRIIVLILYIQNYFETPFFILIQLIFIVILIYKHEKYSNKFKETYAKNINKEYDDKNPEIIIEQNIPEGLIGYQALIGFIFSFWFFYHIDDDHTWISYILNFIFSVFGFAICLVPLFFTARYKESKGILSAKVVLEKTFSHNNAEKKTTIDVTKQFSDIFISDKLLEPNSLLELDPIDFNDTRIANLESELKNIHHRSEAWMLESVFLGGLAFSGFLTVASANFLGREPEVFRKFISHLKNYFFACSQKELLSWLDEIPNFFFRNDLYIIIMLLCLLSSVFFLLVLTLRHRLNSLSLNMDHLIRILIIFNSKEEELFNLNLDRESNIFQISRLEKITKKIDIALIDAENLLKELKPIAVIMNLYRNLAVFLFYLVLIISGFYFMPIIAFLILSLAMFTQIFRLFETYSKNELILNLLHRHKPS